VHHNHKGRKIGPCGGQQPPFSGATGWGKARGARKRSATTPGVEGPDGPVKKRNITIGVPSGNLRYPLEI